jgi:RNA polymerase sigma-70 factor (ECF subfamily)
VLEALGETRILATDSRPEASVRPDDEAWILARLRRGDEAAFETVYRRQERKLYAFALRLSQRTDEAADLTQEVFVKAWENRSRFESLEHLARWLRRVLMNDWINKLRRTRPLELDAPDDEGRGREVEAPRTRDSPVRLDLEKAIAALSPRLRAVFLLFDVHGHGHDEIAELMQMTAGASKVQLHRARKRLQELLQ